jgi:hypothetical protein
MSTQGDEIKRTSDYEVEGKLKTVTSLGPTPEKKRKKQMKRKECYG